MPALGKVKEKARFTVCKTGLKQYGLAGIMYLYENNDTFPHSYNWLYNLQKVQADGISVEHECAWHDDRLDFYKNPSHAGSLWPYLASKDIHCCPTLKNVAKKWGADHHGHSGSTKINPQYSYCMNGYLGLGWTGLIKITKGSQVRRPSDVFFFGEENTWSIEGYSTWSLNNNNLVAKESPFRDDSAELCCFASFHNMKGNDRNSGISNAVFVDGHLQTVDYTQTHELGWPK